MMNILKPSQTAGGREFGCKVWAKELSMKARFALLAGLAVLSAVVSLDAQSKAKSFTAKTSWGDPDLQGVWDYKTITPLERPAAMGDRQFLNDEEVARLEGNAAKRLDSPPDANTPANLVPAPDMT